MNCRGGMRGDNWWVKLAGARYLGLPNLNMDVVNVMVRIWRVIKQAGSESGL